MDPRNQQSKSLACVIAAVMALMTVAMLVACASKTTTPATSTPASKMITDIVTGEDSAATIVTVKGNQPLTYTAVKQDFPQGVLFHFPNTALDNINNVYYPPNNQTIGSIRASEVENGGKTTRVFVALKQDVPYSLKPDGSDLVITFPHPTVQAAPAPAAAAKPEPKKSAAPAAKKAGAAAKPEPKKSAAPAPKKAGAPPATMLKRITTNDHKDHLAINIVANGMVIDHKAFTLKNPDRIVFDLKGIGSPHKTPQTMAGKSKYARKIRHCEHPNKLRVVIDTSRAYLSKYTATPVDTGLLIHIGDVPVSAAATSSAPTAATSSAQVVPKPKKVVAAPKKPAAPPKAAKSSPAVKPAPAPAPKPAPAPAKQTVAAKPNPAKVYSGPAWVNRINFTSEDAGKSAVVIGTTQPVKYDLIRMSDKQLQLTLLNTKLPDYRKHALITTRFSSAVDRITPVEKKKSETHFLIDMREPVPYKINQTDNLIRMEFAASKIPPKPYEDADLPAWKKVVSTGGAKAPLGKVNVVSAKAEPTDSQETSLAERLNSKLPGEKRYTGEKIALDFYDTDIKNVFRIIREISGKNFAIDKNVTGKVTLTLERPVPWDQVLDLVLKMNQLGMTMEGDIIRIATLSTLAQEEKLRQAKLKAEKQAKQQEVALEPLTTEYIPINYSNAESEILPHLQNILTENRGKISVDGRNNQIILTDTAEKIRQAKEIVEQIDKVTPQVIIEARIVEANTNFVREIGFDWGTITLEEFDFGNQATFGPTSFTADNIPANFNNLGSIGFNFATLTGTTFSIVDAKIQAADVEGTTNIVSSPKIVTLDNKKAKIKQGFEVPYLERDSSGNATVNFKDVDLLLEVTPNVTPDDRIVMEIFVTKNDLVDPTADEPALSTNEAETEILVDDGDTIVIGGILKDTSTWAESGIPGLRQIPALGWLFKANKTEERKNELLIFITPQIVKLQQRKLS